MSITFLFMKRQEISMQEILKKTPIQKHIDSSGDLFLKLEENYVQVITKNEDEDKVIGVVRYAGNSAGPFLVHLVDCFNLYFVSAHTLSEAEFGDLLITDEFLEEYRKPLVEEINCSRTNELFELIHKYLKEEYHEITLTPKKEHNKLLLTISKNLAPGFSEHELVRKEAFLKITNTYRNGKKSGAKLTKSKEIDFKPLMQTPGETNEQPLNGHSLSFSNPNDSNS